MRCLYLVKHGRGEKKVQSTSSWKDFLMQIKLLVEGQESRGLSRLRKFSCSYNDRLLRKLIQIPLSEQFESIYLHATPAALLYGCGWRQHPGGELQLSRGPKWAASSAHCPVCSLGSAQPSMETSCGTQTQAKVRNTEP